MGKTKFHIPMVAALILLLLTLITTHMTSGLYARYATSATGSDSARVAKFSITQSILQNGTDMKTTMPMPKILPGDTVDVTVVVEHNTEVAVRNTIKVINVYGNLPLTFHVTETGTAGPGGEVLSVEYGPGQFTKTYNAAITWEPGSNDTDYIGMVDLITITVMSEQVD